MVLKVLVSTPASRWQIIIGRKGGKCDPIFMRLSLGTFTWKGWGWAVGLWCNKTELWSPKDFTTPAKIQNPLMCNTISDISSVSPP